MFLTPHGSTRYLITNFSYPRPLPFRRYLLSNTNPPLSQDDKPSLEVKKFQIPNLWIALIHSQEYCAGNADGVTLRGIDFLSYMAMLYGVNLEFYEPGEYGGEFTDESDAHPKAKAKKCAKYERCRREWIAMVPFIRRYSSSLEDPSSFMIEREWSFACFDGVKTVAIRKSLKRLMNGCSPTPLVFFT